jgi:hypothetical protein
MEAREVAIRRGPFWLDCGLQSTPLDATRAESPTVVVGRLAGGWRTRRAGGACALVQPLLVVEPRPRGSRWQIVPDLTLLSIVGLLVGVGLLGWRGQRGRARRGEERGCRRET